MRSRLSLARLPRTIVQRRAGMGHRGHALVRGRSLPAAVQPRPNHRLGLRRVQASRAVRRARRRRSQVRLRPQLRNELQRQAVGYRRITAEMRPIIGWHLKPVDIIINPILDTAYDGVKNLEFVPAARVAYNFTSGWTAAVEEYDDFGPIHAFAPSGEQAHQLFGVVDRSWKGWDIEAGAGVGLTDGYGPAHAQADYRARSEQAGYRFVRLFLRPCTPEHANHAAGVALVAGVLINRSGGFLQREHRGERPRPGRRILGGEADYYRSSPRRRA